MYDTGAFASAGTTVAGKALHGAALSLREILLATAAGVAGVDSRTTARWSGTVFARVAGCSASPR